MAAAYVDGNGGNIAIRVGEDIALCTPTLFFQGFMKPEDCAWWISMASNSSRTKNRTSEILMHLEIMKRQPRAVATGPLYATRESSKWRLDARHAKP